MKPEITGRKRNRDRNRSRTGDKNRNKGRSKRPEDYRIYRLNASEWLTEITVYAALDMAVSYLFYRSWIVFAAAFALMPFYLKERKAELLSKRKERMRREFLDAAKVLCTQLQTGYSPENAFHETARELSRTCTEETFIRTEIERISVQLTYRLPLEKLLLDWGRRSGVPDITRFTDVFVIARKSGGDLIGIVRSTIQSIEQKTQLQNEIEAELAGKKMEQTMMSFIPMLILAYVGLTSPGFLDPMYKGILGRLIMTVCLAIYAGAVAWSRAIMNESRKNLTEDM